MRGDFIYLSGLQLSKLLNDLRGNKDGLEERIVKELKQRGLRVEDVASKRPTISITIDPTSFGDIQDLLRSIRRRRQERA